MSAPRPAPPLWLSLLPIILFTVLEALTDTTTALIGTLAYTVGELAWIWRRDRRLDALTLTLSGLVLGLGGLSLAADDPRFMYATPVIGDLVFAVILGLSVLRGAPLLRALALKQQPELADDAQALTLLGGMTTRLALNFALHAAACVAAAQVSHAAWLFVSGVGQWLFFGAQFALEYLWVRRDEPPGLP